MVLLGPSHMQCEMWTSQTTLIAIESGFGLFGRFTNRFCSFVTSIAVLQHIKCGPIGPHADSLRVSHHRTQDPWFARSNMAAILEAAFFVTLKLTILQWFAVVWTLIYHVLRHHMVKMLWIYEAQPSESATHFEDVNRGKLAHHGKTLSICFFTTKFRS